MNYKKLFTSFSKALLLTIAWFGGVGLVLAGGAWLITNFGLIIFPALVFLFYLVLTTIGFYQDW